MTRLSPDLTRDGTDGQDVEWRLAALAPEMEDALRAVVDPARTVRQKFDDYRQARDVLRRADEARRMG